MKKTIMVGLGAITATALTLSTALPAQAYIPTISEVRYLNGPDEADEVIGLALTSDAQTAVITTDADQGWVVDVSSNVATEILGMNSPGAVVLDSQETYAYIVSDYFEVTKVDLATAEVDDVWTDTSSSFYASELFLSPDGARLFGVGISGSFPNFVPGVMALNLSSGVISQYDAPNFGVTQQAAYHEASGQILIPYQSGSTGFDIFDTASNTFTDVPWSAAGTLVACDSQSGVVMCLVDDTSPYLAKVSLAGSLLDEAYLDYDAATAMLRVSPDGSLAFVQTYSSASNPGDMQSFDIANMSALPTLLTTVIEDPENMEIAADAGQLWIHGYYGGSQYDGGYHVVQYAEQEGDSGEELANTGADLAMTGSLALVGALALGAGWMTRRAARRQRG